MHDLHVWPEIEADGSHPSKTPGKTSDPDDKMSSLAKVENDIIIKFHGPPKENARKCVLCSFLDFCS